MTGQSAVHKQLLGNTTPDHARTTDTVAFDDRDLGAMARSPFRSSQPPRPCPENDQVEVSVHGDAIDDDILVKPALLRQVPANTGADVKAWLR